MASQPTIFPTDLIVQGRGSFRQLDVPAGSVTDNGVSSTAKIAATKLRHRSHKWFTQERATNAAVEGRVVHVVRGTTGEILEFQVGAVVAITGNSTITVDLLKNGASVLSAVVTLDNATAAYALKAGTVTGSTLAVGDVLEVRVTAVTPGTGTLPKGVFAEVVLDEDPT